MTKFKKNDQVFFRYGTGGSFEKVRILKIERKTDDCVIQYIDRYGSTDKTHISNLLTKDEAIDKFNKWTEE